MNALQTDLRYPADVLARWATDILATQGVGAEAATLTAQALVRTSLRGIDTHGISRLPGYVDKLRTGEVQPRALPRFGLHAGLLECDGAGTFGQVAASHAVHRAMEEARASAVVACRLHSMGHLGALGTLILPAAEQGFMAVLCQRTPPIMAMPGASGPVMGNNPMAFVVPVPGRPPLVFDMAHSVVARGRVAEAQREGLLSIPDRWALGPDGAPTTDPVAALRGTMQPIAGHKGMGLAMLVECLAGCLNGSLTERDSVSAGVMGSPSNVSAFLLVIHPALAIGQATFDASVTAWVESFLSASAHGARYPGQRQAHCETERLRSGIPVAPGVLTALQALGTQCALPFID